MPYIKKEAQQLYDEQIEKLAATLSTPNIDYGHVEYVIFRIVQRLAESNMKFTNLNALIGVLETSKLEIVRRILGPKEDLSLIGNWAEDK